MQLTGELLIGAQAVRGTADPFHAIEAGTGQRLEPAFGGATPEQLEQACALAWQAFDPYRETSLERRAAFLEAIAVNILALGDALVDRCISESGLPRARIEGERARTVGQLRMFADVVRQGDFLDLRVDPAQPERKPLPRADLRLRQIALGPVAVFGASNFPLAFSVAGGDTASALAAGCPVIVKAHCAHPGTSELVGRAVQKAVAELELPAGTFSLLFDAGRRSARGWSATIASRRSLHRLARGRHGADGPGCGARRTDPGLCRDEQYQSGVAVPARAGQPRRGHRHGFRGLADPWGRAVLHQSGPAACGGRR